MFRYSSSQSKQNKSRGQSLVEFVLALPLLLLVMMGALDLGRVFFSTITITNAAREGARYGVLHYTDTTVLTDLQDRAIAEAASSGIDLIRSDITPICVSNDGTTNSIPCTSGQTLRVTVQYQFDLILGFILPSPIHVTRQIEMLIP